MEKTMDKSERLIGESAPRAFYQAAKLLYASDGHGPSCACQGCAAFRRAEFEARLVLEPVAGVRVYCPAANLIGRCLSKRGEFIEVEFAQYVGFVGGRHAYSVTSRYMQPRDLVPVTMATSEARDQFLRAFKAAP